MTSNVVLIIHVAIHVTVQEVFSAINIEKNLTMQSNVKTIDEERFTCISQERCVQCITSIIKYYATCYGIKFVGDNHGI